MAGRQTYDHQLEAVLAALDSGAPLPTEGADPVGNMAVIDAIYADGPDEDISIGQLGKYYGRNVLAPQIVGTGVQVADWIEETIAEVGGDGFMLSPASLPSSIEDFVERWSANPRANCSSHRKA